MKKSVILLFFLLNISISSFCQFSPGYYALKYVSVADLIKAMQKNKTILDATLVAF